MPKILEAQLAQSLVVEQISDMVRIYASALTEEHAISYGPVVLRDVDYVRIGKSRIVEALVDDLRQFPPQEADKRLFGGEVDGQPFIYVVAFDGTNVALPRYQRRLDDLI